MLNFKRLATLILIAISLIAGFFLTVSRPALSCGLNFICGDGTLLFCETFGNCGGHEVCGYYRYYSGGPIRGIFCEYGGAWWGSYCEVVPPMV